MFSLNEILSWQRSNFNRIMPWSAYWVLLCLGACAELPCVPTNEPAEPPSSAEAAAIVTWAHLGQTTHVPVVHWVQGPCIEGMGFSRCIAGGVFLPDLGEIWVIALARPVTETALVHELIHAAGTYDEAEARRRTGPEIGYLRSLGGF